MKRESDRREIKDFENKDSEKVTIKARAKRNIKDPKELQPGQEYIGHMLDWYSFETKSRHMVRELIQPVIDKAVKDRELIFCLEKVDSRILDRVDLLEMTLYNRETGTGRTKFDEMEEKMMNLNTKISGSIERIETKSDAFMDKINNYLFDIDTKLVSMNTFEEKI